MIIPKEFRRGELITSPAELRKIANKIMQERLNDDNIKDAKDSVKVSLFIFNKKGYKDTWRFE